MEELEERKEYDNILYEKLQRTSVRRRVLISSVFSQVSYSIVDIH